MDTHNIQSTPVSKRKMSDEDTPEIVSLDTPLRQKLKLLETLPTTVSQVSTGSDLTKDSKARVSLPFDNFPSELLSKNKKKVTPESIEREQKYTTFESDFHIGRVHYVIINQIGITEERELFVLVQYFDYFPGQWFWRRATSFDDKFIKILQYRLKLYFCEQRGELLTYEFLVGLLQKEVSWVYKFNPNRGHRSRIGRELFYDYIKKSGPVTKEYRQLNKWLDPQEHKNRTVEEWKKLNIIGLNGLLNFKMLQNITSFHCLEIESKKCVTLLHDNIKHLYHDIKLQDPTSTGIKKTYYYFNGCETAGDSKDTEAMHSGMCMENKVLPLIPSFNEIIKQVYQYRQQMNLDKLYGFEYNKPVLDTGVNDVGEAIVAEINYRRNCVETTFDEFVVTGIWDENIFGTSIENLIYATSLNDTSINSTINLAPVQSNCSSLIDNEIRDSDSAGMEMEESGTNNACETTNSSNNSIVNNSNLAKPAESVFSDVEEEELRRQAETAVDAAVNDAVVNDAVVNVFKKVLKDTVMKTLCTSGIFRDGRKRKPLQDITSTAQNIR